jgi:hypothetical protein
MDIWLGGRPTSPGEDACTSPMNGRVPYMWVYQANEPVARCVTETRVAWEWRSDQDVNQAYGMKARGVTDLECVGRRGIGIVPIRA